MARLALLKKWALEARGRNQNFACDQFARDFQNKLADNHISFTPKVLGFKRSEGNSYRHESELMSGRKRVGTKLLRGKPIANYVDALHVEPKIVLHAKGHPFDGKIIGNETHFWTEVQLDDGQWYCFDNHHPQGLLRANYFQQFEFKLDKVLQGEFGAISQRELFDDNLHQYKSHAEILTSEHLVVKDIPANEYVSPENNIYKWTTQPAQYFKHYATHYLNENTMASLTALVTNQVEPVAKALPFFSSSAKPEKVIEDVINAQRRF